MKFFRAVYDRSIKPFIDTLTNAVNSIIEEVSSKMNKLTVPLFIYSLCHTNGLGKSFDEVVSDLKLNNKIAITKGAIMNKRKVIRATHIKSLNKRLTDHIFKNDQHKVKIVDGSFLYLPKQFTKYGFQLSNNGSCCKILLSTIIDAETSIPISMHIHKTLNERDAFVKQLNFLERDDLVIFDGGYFSKELVCILNDRHLQYIFRISDTTIFAKQLNKQQKNDLLINYQLEKNYDVQLRAIKYTYKDISNELGSLITKKKYIKSRQIDQKRKSHKSNIYYLVTSYVNKYTLAEFMTLYNDRWKIELYFRYLKHDLSFDRIRAKSYDTLKQDLYIHHFISIVSLYIKYLLTKENNRHFRPNQYINTKTCTYIVISKLMEIILLKYKSGNRRTKENVCNILQVITEVTIISKKGRYYERVRKRPLSKWNHSGSTSDRPKKAKKGIKNEKTSAVHIKHIKKSPPSKLSSKKPSKKIAISRKTDIT